MNLFNLIKSFLIISLLSISFTLIAQDEFESKENRKLIKDFKIREIKSYLYAEGGNPGDSILVNHSFFNKKGLCVKEITPDYITAYEYNTDNLKVKAISERSGKTGQSVIVYNYDNRGNMILSERVQEGYE